MTSPGVRSAQAALDAARAVIERLDGVRRPETNAADLAAAWDAVQSALRTALGVTSLSGNDLIREARQRGALALGQAHDLVALGAAAERAHARDYVVTPEDIAAARQALAALESPPAAASPAAHDLGAPPQAASGPVTPDPVPRSAPAPGTPRRNYLAGGVALTAVLVVAAVAIYYAWYFRRGPDHLTRGIEAYEAGDAGSARRELDAAVRAMPTAALPHVYLARLAREGGDPATAVNELTSAIRLEPGNAVALREMGSYALSIGDLDVARRFYVRALEQNPADRPALGYLACALARLGRPDEAQDFLWRAGDGAWSACVAGAPAPGR